MEKKRGGYREGSGRKKGVPNFNNSSLKNKHFLGYRYTEEEYNQMKEALKKYISRNKCTTSQALMNIILGSDKL